MELLVVIAIIGILIALLLPAVQAAREAARRSACVNNLRQQSVAMQNYHSQYNRFPPGGAMHSTSGQTGVSWRVVLLPFLEENTLHERIGPTASGGATNWVPQSEMPTLFRCPSAEPAVIGASTLQISNYWGVAGARRVGQGIDLEDFSCGDLDANGVLYPGSKAKISKITDGTSHTIAIGERAYAFRAWMTGATWVGSPPVRICAEAAKNIRYPINANHDKWGYFKGHNPLPPGGMRSMLLNDLPFGSDHSGGANFCRADGSVDFLTEDTDFTVFEALATINGGEINQADP